MKGNESHFSQWNLEKCLFAWNGNEDWGQEITEEIHYGDVYMQPFFLTAWKMVCCEWSTSPVLSLTRLVQILHARARRFGLRYQIWNEYAILVKAALYQQLCIAGNNMDSHRYLKRRAASAVGLKNKSAHRTLIFLRRLILPHVSFFLVAS